MSDRQNKNGKATNDNGFSDKIDFRFSSFRETHEINNDNVSLQSPKEGDTPQPPPI